MRGIVAVYQSDIRQFHYFFVQLQHNVEMLADIMLQIGNYFLMALAEHQKNQQEAA